MATTELTTKVTLTITLKNNKKVQIDVPTKLNKKNTQGFVQEIVKAIEDVYGKE